MSKILIHFDGEITKQHRVTLRTLGKSLHHLQAAVDRAYLDTKYGQVWKNARMSKEDYVETALWSQAPQEGGFVIDFINDSPKIRQTLSRMINAISPAIEKSKQASLVNAGTLAEQASIRSQQITAGIYEPLGYETFKPSLNPYGDRAINKEIDQILGIIRSPGAGKSTIELEITPETSTTKFSFNKINSQNFHAVVSKRNLGEPLSFEVVVHELDHKNKNGTVTNISNGKSIKLHFADEASFLNIKNYLGSPEHLKFVGCPIYEGGAFDATAGDIFFIGLTQWNN
ncbi:hypothetical protein SOP85_09725 [Pseudomonas sp. YuFO20]|uniref:hypothetical protein n=1 Tax=Pseudomonas sp. YuFO20 TaxID=3095362 RepID=UPI002B240CA4|nr:hypothetical protein [Pseudomonas sp. YuFO20]MEB2515715.1 hypothetical protein [Pseudomonas sp. YuFO20]